MGSDESVKITCRFLCRGPVLKHSASTRFMDKPDGQLSDDQREKADQSLKDGAESGVYLPPEAEVPQSLKSRQPDNEPSDDPQSGDDQQTETLGQRIFAILFLPTLLAVIGGVVCMVGGQYAIAMENDHHHHHFQPEDEPDKFDWFVLFRIPGLRDWRVQFFIGAVIGAASGLLFCYQFWTGRVQEFDPEKIDEPRV